MTYWILHQNMDMNKTFGIYKAELERVEFGRGKSSVMIHAMENDDRKTEWFVEELAKHVTRHLALPKRGEIDEKKDRPGSGLKLVHRTFVITWKYEADRAKQRMIHQYILDEVEKMTRKFDFEFTDVT